MTLSSSRPESTPIVIGVVHLLPLPGSPRYGGDRRAVRQAALADAQAYLDGGVHGLIVENHGDAPFHKQAVEPWVICEMTAVAGELARLTGDNHLLGINVLRNDARAAVAIAAASGAQFVRVNVHCGCMVTDQGVIEGRAAETLRDRRTMDAEGIAIWADVAVKHAVPLGPFDLVQTARDTIQRGGVGALIVSGSGTGRPVDMAELATLRDAVPGAALYVGSGVDGANIDAVLKLADGVIVGTSLKQDGRIEEPVDRERVAALMQQVGQHRSL